MSEELTKVALAALLHDVGKFAQRAVPVSRRAKHTDAGADFAREHVPQLFRDGLYPINTHHDPVNKMDRLTKLVALADRLVAAEREEEQETMPRRLRSVFDFVRLPPTEGERAAPTPDELGHAHYLPLKVLSLDCKDDLFPAQGSGEVGEATYRDLWDKFVTEVDAVPALVGDNLDLYVETLYYLLQKYAWCVPSAYYKAETDISLFDHSRVTAAVAVCLAADNLSDAELTRMLTADREADQEDRFLLLGGDISGVQDFIYTVTSEGAAKGLRGRSVYLQWLNEALARWTMRQLGLPFLNLLYVGGGNFYAVVPLLAGERLDDIRRDVSRRLLAIHGGDLYLALATVPLAAGDLASRRWAVKWRQVGGALGQAKQRRFAELREEMHGALFEPRGTGGEPNFCDVCKNDEGDLVSRDDVKLCRLCDSLEDLGGQIAEARWLVWAEVEPTEVTDKGSWRWQEALAVFGAAPEPTRWVERVTRPAEAHRVIAYRLTDTGFLIEPEDKLPRAYGFRFLARAVPRLGRDKKRDDGTTAHQGDIATFTDLAEASDGIERLGVLRMDVDGLGAIFSEGLEERASASRLATLSFLIQLFFNGWLGRICEQWPLSDKGDGKVYLTYAGGDDLFLVGAWDAMADLAWEIRQDFDLFVGHNANVTISAGISLVTKKFPLYKAADMAHMALDVEAKGVRRRRDGRVAAKDAISFLGKPLGWEDFAAVREMKDYLVALLRPEDDDRPVPRSLLTRLKQIHSLYARNEQAQVQRLLAAEAVAMETYLREILYDKWRWRLAYGLSRFKEGHTQHGEVLEKVRQWIVQGGDERVAFLDLPVRWVELLTREQEKGEKHE